MHPEGRNGEEDREAVEWGRGYRSLSVNHPTKRETANTREQGPLTALRLPVLQRVGSRANDPGRPGRSAAEGLPDAALRGP